jgi:hypothetical protein
MPADVIDRVHTLARRSGANNGLIFSDRSGIPFQDPDDGDDDDNESYQPDDDSVNPNDDDFTDNFPIVLGVEPDVTVAHIPIVGVDDDNDMVNETGHTI